MTLLFVALYFAVLLALCSYGLHRAHLVWLLWRYRKTIGTLKTKVISDDNAPVVTVQLPLYNEATVVGRLLDAAGSLDYPRREA